MTALCMHVLMLQAGDVSRDLPPRMMTAGSLRSPAQGRQGFALDGTAAGSGLLPIAGSVLAAGRLGGSLTGGRWQSPCLVAWGYPVLPHVWTVPVPLYPCLSFQL